LCRVFGRHLDLLQVPVRVGGIESVHAVVFPAETVLDEPTSSDALALTLVAEAVKA